MKKILGKLHRWWIKITSKEHHLKFITSVLSIPVLLTAILLNLNNLNANKRPVTTDQPKQNQIIISLPAQKEIQAATPTPVPTKAACDPGVGNVAISYPDEGDTITDNPVNVAISVPNDTHCAVVWSYRINGGSWSNYDNKSIALFNPPSGNIIFDLRVQSIVSGADTKTLTRNFIYKSSAAPTTQPTNTPAPTQSSAQ